MNDKTKEADYPRFVSTTGEATMIALVRGGHSVSIGTLEQTDGKGTPLHPRFHRAAVMKGCMPVGSHQSVEAEQEGTVHHDRAALLRKAISDMVELGANDPAKQVELFTNDGRPDARQMSLRLGFPVNATERDEAWEAYAGKDPADEG